MIDKQTMSSILAWILTLSTIVIGTNFLIIPLDSLNFFFSQRYHDNNDVNHLYRSVLEIILVRLLGGAIFSFGVFTTSLRMIVSLCPASRSRLIFVSHATLGLIFVLVQLFHNYDPTAQGIRNISRKSNGDTVLGNLTKSNIEDFYFTANTMHKMRSEYDDDSINILPILCVGVNYLIISFIGLMTSYWPSTNPNILENSIENSSVLHSPVSHNENEEQIVKKCMCCFKSRLRRNQRDDEIAVDLEGAVCDLSEPLLSCNNSDEFEHDLSGLDHLCNNCDDIVINGDSHTVGRFGTECNIDDSIVLSKKSYQQKDYSEAISVNSNAGDRGSEQSSEQAILSDRTSRVTGTKRLIKLAGPHSSHLYMGCLVLLIRLPFSLSIPHFVSTTLGALAHAEYDRAKTNILLLFVLGTVDAALDFWCIYLFGLANLKIVREVRIDTFAAILRQDMAFFDHCKSGDLASRLSSDCGEMGNDLTWFFRFSIESIVRISGIVTYMLVRCPRLGLFALSAVPVVSFINKKYGDWLHKNAILVQTALAKSNSIAQETFSCIRDVVAFATEKYSLHLYHDQINQHYNLNLLQVTLF